MINFTKALNSISLDSVTAYLILYCISLAVGILFMAAIWFILPVKPWGISISQYIISIVLLMLPLVACNRILGSLEAKRQLIDANKQPAEARFMDALQQLLIENKSAHDALKKSAGLKELLRLKQENIINSDRIDIVTSSNLNLEYADLGYAKLMSANLRGANLTKAKLQGAELQYATLITANLTNANLEHANLAKANMLHAIIANANLEKTDLKDANMQYTDMQHTNLANANLHGANLTNAIYNDDTQFPDDFNPEEAGMIHISCNITLKV